MDQFEGRIAVVTGGGTGMGRELCLALVKAGAHVATCDVLEENLAETRQLCEALAGDGVRFTTHRCDVASEADVMAFRDEVAEQHKTEHINLL